MMATATGAAARRSRARQEMREAILDVAGEMVAKEGVANLSMRAIARELGYSPAALYEYFPGKEELCKALYCEGASGLNSRMQGAIDSLPEDGSMLDGLKALGRAYRSYAFEQPELFRLMFDGRSAGHDPDAEEMTLAHEGYEILLDVARRGVERGFLLEMPADVVAVTAWALVHGFVTLELSGVIDPDDPDCGPGDRLPNDHLFEAALETLAHGLARR